MSTIVRSDVVYARVNWGRWIVDCWGCTSALKLNPGESYFRCWDCGAQADICWPSFVDGIERILLMRPDPNTRNWEPGESLTDLMAENVEHGHLPVPCKQLDGSAVLFAIEGDRVTADPHAPVTLATLGAATHGALPAQNKVG